MSQRKRSSQRSATSLRYPERGNNRPSFHVLEIREIDDDVIIRARPIELDRAAARFEVIPDVFRRLPARYDDPDAPGLERLEALLHDEERAGRDLSPRNDMFFVAVSGIHLPILSERPRRGKTRRGDSVRRSRGAFRAFPRYLRAKPSRRPDRRPRLPERREASGCSVRRTARPFRRTRSRQPGKRIPSRRSVSLFPL